MPRYLLETSGGIPGGIDTAVAMAAARFPEIGVEHRYTGRESSGHEIWICTAPSASHVTRWAAAAEIDFQSIDQVDDEPTTPLASRRAQPKKENIE